MNMNPTKYNIIIYSKRKMIGPNKINTTTYNFINKTMNNSKISKNTYWIKNNKIFYFFLAQ